MFYMCVRACLLCACAVYGMIRAEIGWSESATVRTAPDYACVWSCSCVCTHARWGKCKQRLVAAVGFISVSPVVGACLRASSRAPLSPALRPHPRPLCACAVSPSSMSGKADLSGGAGRRLSSMGAARSGPDPAGTLAAAEDGDAAVDDFDMDKGTASAKRAAPSVMGFGRRRDQEQMPVDIPELLDGVKVDVYVRCGPLRIRPCCLHVKARADGGGRGRCQLRLPRVHRDRASSHVRCRPRCPLLPLCAGAAPCFLRR